MRGQDRTGEDKTGEDGGEDRTGQEDERPQAVMKMRVEPIHEVCG